MVVNEYEKRHKVYCPGCDANIIDGEFSIDSEYPGTLDIGYSCDECNIDVYLYKVEYIPVEEEEI